MEMNSVAHAALLLLTLSGCSLPRPWERVDLDDVKQEQVFAIDALPEIKTETLNKARYTSLGSVEGVSCKRSSKEVASWEDAIRRTKYRAMQKGANAIANLSCEEPKGRSLTTLCFESIRCIATAVQVN
jgi:uncharacterized protein YbjQ (UPF0145 family)